MTPDYLLFTIILFLGIGVYALMRLAIEFNCHVQSEYNKKLLVKKKMRDKFMNYQYRVRRYKWMTDNKEILIHYWEKYHNHMKFKKFVILAYSEKLYIDM